MMLGRDESMPNVDPKADLSSEDRDLARAFALDLLTGRVDMSLVPPRLASVMARAVVRYVPAGVPEPAPHEVATADDMTRPAPLPPAGLKPCTCSTTPCRGADGLGDLWYCQRTLERGRPAPLQAGVICEPIEDVSSGVCEVSDDSSTSQNRLNFTAAYDVDVHGDITKR